MSIYNNIKTPFIIQGMCNRTKIRDRIWSAFCIAPDRKSNDYPHKSEKFITHCLSTIKDADMILYI